MSAPELPRAARTSDLSPRTRYALGALMLAFGGFIVAIALRWIDIAPTRGTPYWIVGLAGGLFSLAGIALLLPTRLSRALDVVGALLFSGFANLGLWVGFGPGERQFSGSFSAGPVGTAGGGNASLGRFMFGTMGILVAVVALLAWRRVFRPRNGSDPPES